jgi:hypothetical protein
MIKFLQHTYAQTRTAADNGADKFLDQMTGPELLSLHNLVASNLGKGSTKRFADTKTALRRTWAILEEYQATDVGTVDQPEGDRADFARREAEYERAVDPKPKVERKKRGMRFVFAPEDEVRQAREGTARAKALAILRRDEGATFEEVSAVTGWTEKQTYEGIRIVHYYLGWGLRETVVDGKTRIHAYSKK